MINAIFLGLGLLLFKKKSYVNRVFFVLCPWQVHADDCMWYLCHYQTMACTKEGKSLKKKQKPNTALLWMTFCHILPLYFSNLCFTTFVFFLYHHPISFYLFVQQLARKLIRGAWLLSATLTHTHARTHMQTHTHKPRSPLKDGIWRP